MGMQVSSYELIAALGGEARDQPAMIIRKALADFAMVAIVLHRPGIDVALGAVLQREFARLDRETGKHLLFLALTEAGPDWHQHAGQRSYYQALREEVPYAHPEVVNWADSDAAALAVAGRLGIPGEELPCIVFTEDLAREEFAWMSTGPSLLCEQLLSLGRVATELGPALRTYSRLPKVAARYAAPALNLSAIAADVACGARFGEGEPGSRLATSLLDIIAVGEGLGASSSEGKVRVARRESVLARLASEIVNLRRTRDGDSDELAERVLELAQLQALGIPQLQVWPERRGPRPELMGLMLGSPESTRAPAWRAWHTDAQLAVNTADKLLRVFAEDADFDWSTAVVSTGKALEIEANHSIVQLLRLHLGAQMPDHYRIVAPRVPMLVASGPVVVDLNAARKGKWAPLALGVVGHVLRNPVAREATSRIQHEVHYAASKLIKLSEITLTLVELRNPGAHDEIMSLPKAQQARAELDKLALNGGAEFLRACKAATAPAGS